MQLQGGTSDLQGGSIGVQSPGNAQPASQIQLQPATNVQNYVDPTDNTAVLGATTSVDPAVAAAAAQAAADAARAASLRSSVSNLVSSIKDIFNTRYGQVDNLAKEQTGKLNTRFGNESADLANQVEGENQKIGAAHAAAGTFDSSYRGNNVDTETRAGQAQIRDLGQELQDNIAKIAAWVSQQKAGFGAQTQGYNAVLDQIANETDPGTLASIQASIQQKLTDLRSQGADYQTQGEQAQALNAVAPASARAVQLKTTLSDILGGNADPNSKLAIANSLVTNSGVSPEDQQQLLTAFQSDLNSNTTPQTDQNSNVVSA